MARIKTKDLKNSYLFRVYDEEENKVLKERQKYSQISLIAKVIW